MDLVAINYTGINYHGRGFARFLLRSERATVGILTRINGMCAIRCEQQQASLYECTSCKT